MKNSSIDRFVQDIQEVDDEKGEVVASLRKMVLQTAPHVREEIKYGGIVFLGNDELLSGIFIRKNHVTIEFGSGAQMKDPEGILQGRGKYRRHLKIFSNEDIEKKQVEFFVKQCPELQDSA